MVLHFLMNIGGRVSVPQEKGVNMSIIVQECVVPLRKVILQSVGLLRGRSGPSLMATGVDDWGRLEELGFSVVRGWATGGVQSHWFPNSKVCVSLSLSLIS